tara:strand:+ start:1725 stop:1982 length:258 start_codon:yes stop_codon:yes gene_type:complete
LIKIIFSLYNTNMFDWVWRSLGYELEKDIVKEWALNKMKAEKIEERLMLEKLKTAVISPDIPVRQSTRLLSIKQREQQKSYASVV